MDRKGLDEIYRNFKDIWRRYGPNAEYIKDCYILQILDRSNLGEERERQESQSTKAKSSQAKKEGEGYGRDPEVDQA